jgi:hypothetical protein
MTYRYLGIHVCRRRVAGQDDRCAALNVSSGLVDPPVGASRLSDAVALIPESLQQLVGRRTRLCDDLLPHSARCRRSKWWPWGQAEACAEAKTPWAQAVLASIRMEGHTRLESTAWRIKGERGALMGCAKLRDCDVGHLVCAAASATWVGAGLAAHAPLGRAGTPNSSHLPKLPGDTNAPHSPRPAADGRAQAAPPASGRPASGPAAAPRSAPRPPGRGAPPHGRAPAAPSPRREPGAGQYPLGFSQSPTPARALAPARGHAAGAGPGRGRGARGRWPRARRRQGRHRASPRGRHSASLFRVLMLSRAAK